jgi:lipopolysaccharide export LptBFGC system permease protein LptF
MSTLDRWLLRRFTVAYLGFSTSVLVVYVVTDLFNRFDRFVGADKSFFATFLKHYATVVPEIWYVLAPFITLIAGCWVVFELQRNNELVPLLAAGVAPLRIVAPIFFAALLLGALAWADSELLLPRFAEARREASKLRRDVLVPTPIPDRVNGVLMARNYVPKEKVLSEAHYERMTADETISIVASFARFVNEKDQQGWLFVQGVAVETSAGGQARVSAFGPAGRLVRTDVQPEDLESASVQTMTYLTSDQIQGQIARAPSLKHLHVELAKRWSYPASALVLLILGFPFVMRGDAREAAFGLLGCIAICALFFLATAFCEDWGSRPGNDFPKLAAWLPNLLFGGAGLIAFLRRAGKG